MLKSVKSQNRFLSVAFAPDGQTFAIGDADGAIEIRQTADAKLLATFTGNTGHLTALTYSPDGLRLASASGEGVIRLWDTKTGDQVLAIRTGAPNMSFLAFTPDGNTLISHGTVGKIQTLGSCTSLNLRQESPSRIFATKEFFTPPDTTLALFLAYRG